MQDTLSEEQKAKDEFFERISLLSQEMVKAYGKDFAMGALVLGARWIAEGKAGGAGEASPAKQ